MARRHCPAGGVRGGGLVYGRVVLAFLPVDLWRVLQFG